MASGQLEAAEVWLGVMRVNSAQHSVAPECHVLLRRTVLCMLLQIPGCQTAYCKFEIVAGEDWQILDGMDNGITQVARQSTGVC